MRGVYDAIDVLSEYKVREERDVVVSGGGSPGADAADHVGVAGGAGQKCETAVVVRLVQTFLRQSKLTARRRQLRQLLPLLLRLHSQHDNTR